jgi:hypothetical protein
MRRPGRSVGSIIVLLAGAGLVGCSAQPNVVGPPKEFYNLSYVAAAYETASSALGRSPKNLEELKPYLKTYGDPDQVMTSPNDGKPFVVVWNVRVGGSGYPILAYEREGKDGMRQVVDTRGAPWKVTEEQFARIKRRTEEVKEPTDK